VTPLLVDWPEDARATLLLAHGVGAGMEHEWMVMMAGGRRRRRRSCCSLGSLSGPVGRCPLTAGAAPRRCDAGSIATVAAATTIATT